MSSIEADQGLASGTVTRGGNPMTEHELDQVIDDSFPASDPPSHTPTLGVGPAEVVAREPGSGHWKGRVPLLASAAVVAVAGASIAVLMLRRRV